MEASSSSSISPPQLYSAGSTGRRHANGLPSRQPSGATPGLPFLSELARRYPVRQAPDNGPEVALVSGQLFVCKRLCDAMAGPRSHHVARNQPALAANSSSSRPVLEQQYHEQPPPQLQLHNHHHPTQLPASRAEQLYPPGGSYLQQRRAEKEQRRLQQQQQKQLLLQQQQREACTSGANDRANPTAGRPQGGITAWGSRPCSASGDAAGPANGATANGATGKSTLGASAVAAYKQHVNSRREGVERWLASHETVPPLEDGSRSGSADGSAEEIGLPYYQYGVVRNYGKTTTSPGRLSPPGASLMPLRGGPRVAFAQQDSNGGVVGSWGTVMARPQRR